MVGWVIGEPSQKEKKELLDAFGRAVDAAACIIESGSAAAMKRAFALLLAAAVCAVVLSGCGKTKEGTVKSGLYYDASGISPDAVLLTVDGRDVTAGRYFYWLTDACDSMLKPPI